MITLNTQHAFLKEEIKSYQEEVRKHHENLMNKKGVGNDFTGWVEWPNTYDKEEFQKIQEVANQWKTKCDVLLVCGIGGSYLGARAAIEMMNGLFSKKQPEILFIGNTFSSTTGKHRINKN